MSKPTVVQVIGNIGKDKRFYAKIAKWPNGHFSAQIFNMKSDTLIADMGSPTKKQAIEKANDWLEMQGVIHERHRLRNRRAKGAREGIRRSECEARKEGSRRVP